MRNSTNILVLFFFLFFKSELFAQFYSMGEPPASVKWNQIKTEHYKLIFPAEISETSKNLANKFEYYYPLIKQGMGSSSRRIPVILYSTSTLSNGFVTLAPRRMELVVTPPQDLLAQDWSGHLTLHESRHVVQIDRQYQGITRLFSYISGDIIPGIVSSQIPPWFYEGDAVLNETLLSNAGRGRSPGFKMPLKPILNENDRIFSYDKAIFGSYKDFVPDHYLYGYEMVNYAHSKYGSDIWPEALKFTSRNPFLIWPFAIFLKKTHNIYKSNLYEQTIDSLSENYNKIKITEGNVIYKHLNHTKKEFNNYLLPKEVNNNSIVYISKGLSEPGSIVVADSTGSIKKRWTTGISTNLKNDIYGNNLVWDEIIVDPRWERRDYSVIKEINIKTGKKRSITKKTKYFSPDFSYDGKNIAVIEVNDANENFLTIINSNTGKAEKRIPSYNKILQTPEWISNNEICVITVTEQGKQLEIINIVDETNKVLIENTYLDIAEPLKFHDFIIFRCGYKEIDNLFAIQIFNKQIFQVTYSKYGAYHPSITKDSMSVIFSEYGLNGFDIAKLDINVSSWVKLNNEEFILEKSETVLNNDSIKILETEIKKFNKAVNLFRFHSWLPFYFDIDDLMDDPVNTKINPGLMLFSQNILNTFISSFSYSYNNGYSSFIPSLKWRGWYPVIELTGQIGGPVMKLSVPSEVNVPKDKYKEINLKVYIPWTFYRGKKITFIQPRIEYELSSYWYYTNKSLYNGMDFLHLKFYLYNIQRSSLRDIYPKWGQSFYVTHTTSLSNKDLFGTLSSFESNLFFPGIFRHNSFNINVSYQIQKPDKYFLNINRIDFPRGYLTEFSKELSILQFNYSFPFWYPDFSIGPLIYLKRLRANVFYDTGYRVDIDRKTWNYKSFGIESFADIHALRIIFPLSVGVRAGYIPDYSHFFSEFLFNINTSIF